MQFVKNGPDIPERLLHAHEEGKVVFFCGAGISSPARLPGFGELVDQLYRDLKSAPDEVQRAAIKAKQYDTAIGLLESDLLDGRREVRHALAKILDPDLTAKHSTRTHEALLTLSKDRYGRTRLITTNFDRLFELVLDRASAPVERFQAPLLPVPKTRWNGLVYLHGLLSKKPIESELDRLVLSSGDFGMAYLTERWAARFVSELFRNYTICFVGYSINDPVLRYMMDALAADRLLGESPPEMFAFGCFSKGNKKNTENEWRAKNVTPILYAKHHRHAHLHNTLRAWSMIYRDGILGKEGIVAEYAMAHPVESTESDNFIGRMLWALSDSSGIPAKRFAEMDPVPSIAWLDVLGEPRFRNVDLNRFGIEPLHGNDEALKFSLLQRPPQYNRAVPMELVTYGARGSEWDDTLHHLTRWLVRHLGDPTLLLWMSKHGGHLHDRTIQAIDRHLNHVDRLEHEANSRQLADIRSNAPNAVPSSPMRVLWDLFLTRRVKSSSGRGSDLFKWKERVARDGVTATLRMELYEMLTPCVLLRAPYHIKDPIYVDCHSSTINNLVEWEVTLTADDVHSNLRTFREDAHWIEAAPRLLPDFIALLHNVLDLKRQLGGAQDQSDLSYIQQPSISDHSQNQDFHDWTALIDMTRDAWIVLAKESPERAKHVAESFWHVPYPLFRRLALFSAATHETPIPLNQALQWLLTDESWWLWSPETKREAIRLLVSLAPRLDKPGLGKLERAILVGPPRRMYREDITVEDWSRKCKYEIWLRLAKATASGAVLSDTAHNRLTEISTNYPSWQISEDERDEFSFWMESGWEKGDDPDLSTTQFPHGKDELVTYLSENPLQEDYEQNIWRKRCREDLKYTAEILHALAIKRVWRIELWQGALHTWSEEDFHEDSWLAVSSVLAKAPDDLFNFIAPTIGNWLREIAPAFQGRIHLFFSLIHRVLDIDYEESTDGKKPIRDALNHPVGYVSEALLRWWYRQSPQLGQKLPNQIKGVFTRLCDTNTAKFRHSRVFLALHAVSLFQVDEEWSREHLIPLFAWENSPVEAGIVWQGFLWSPRLHIALMEALKPAFLETARHYDDLHESAAQYASFLTLVALNQSPVFTEGELAMACSLLPPNGLNEVARTLVRALDGSGDQRSEYWTNRVSPFLKKIWPKSRDHLYPEFAGSVARLCIAAEDSFPAAVEETRGLLQPLQHMDFVVNSAFESKLCENYPEHSLEFLDRVVDKNAQWIPRKLRDCLDTIKRANSAVGTDPRFLSLSTFAHRFE